MIPITAPWTFNLLADVTAQNEIFTLPQVKRDHEAERDFAPRRFARVGCLATRSS